MLLSQKSLEQRNCSTNFINYANIIYDTNKEQSHNFFVCKLNFKNTQPVA